MFEVPDAKRVRRDELYGSESERDEVSPGQEDAAARARLNEKLSQMFSLDLFLQLPEDGNSDEQLPDASHDGQSLDEPAFEFRLFSTTGSAPKIVVKDPDEGDGDVMSSRPKSFHLKDEFSPEELQRFGESAVSYSDVVQGAQQRAWGLEVPWRVTKIVITSGSAVSSASKGESKTKSDAGEPGKKKRPGKKRRIAFRIKEKERKQKEEQRRAKEEEAAKQRLTKEEHLREKKKRLNREKKMKRRRKEKEKKLAGQTGGEADEGAGDDSGSSGSEGGDP